MGNKHFKNYLPHPWRFQRKKIKIIVFPFAENLHVGVDLCGEIQCLIFGRRKSPSVIMVGVKDGALKAALGVGWVAPRFGRRSRSRANSYAGAAQNRAKIRAVVSQEGCYTIERYAFLFYLCFKMKCTDIKMHGNRGTEIFGAWSFKKILIMILRNYKNRSSSF